MSLNDTTVQEISAMSREGVLEGNNLPTKASEVPLEQAASSTTRSNRPDEAAIINRALSYPYERPAQSYLYRDGKAHKLTAKQFDGLHFVLAIGSNAAPAQLQRKFGNNVSIPVVAVEVHGMDVVYAAIMSSYGSIPATVVKSEGTVISVHATLLTNDQLRRMHETEGGYYFCQMVEGKGARVVWDGVEVRTVYCYVTRNGALCNEEILSIAEIAAKNRVYRAVSQREVQMIVEGLIDCEEDVEEFVAKNVGSKDRRDETMDRMKGTVALDDCFEIVQDIGSVITSVK